MSPRHKSSSTLAPDQKTADYRYATEKRTNIPPSRMAGEGRVPPQPKAQYAYSPHRPPTLRFDETGESDRLSALLDKATRSALSAAEAEQLREALRAGPGA